MIGIEEATTLSHRKYVDISTCCRSSKVFADGHYAHGVLADGAFAGGHHSDSARAEARRHWRPRIYSTTNPGGIGHAWYRAKYVTPYLHHQEPDTRFIPARVTDNQFNNPEYRKVLEGLNGWQRRAWLDGDWDIAAGQFFTNFRRDIHVIADFDDRRARQWFAAMDYGFTHYTVVLLGCKDGDGNLFIVDEHAERLWLPERHGRAIHQMLERHNLRAHHLSWFVAGSDVFSRQSDGSTVATQYRDLGFHLRPANTDRIQGWAELLRRLGDPDAGLRPTLSIHDRCRRLVESLPSLQHDPNRPEDVLKVDIDEDGHGGDDAADAARYLVNSQPPTVVMRKLRGL